ncbi:Ig-like domain-containing protein [Gottfriedia acidiceleris]|uniref:Ig-like domain-containing protein n=1 Tax=Gottfriedia acidiceleris TaxID=371036 RepID=UPI00101C5418|nr:Ig-like domain-containing protein [Gottfriedia acidiceleris]
MLNKKILSLVTLGLLVSPLSLGNVKAEGNAYDFSKKMIEHQVKKPLQKGILDFHTFNQLGKEVNYARSFSVKSFNKMGTMNKGNVTSADDDFIYETEYNDEFNYADNTSYDKILIGQLLPLYDLDLHKVVVPTDGLLYVAGATNSINIDLLFAAVEKDFVESNKLVYLGSEYDDDGTEYQAYQAKAGTYYVGVMDYDNADDIDNNTEDDLYAIATGFEDNVAPNKPIINKVDNNDVVVTGKAEANSTISVKVGSTQIGTAKASSKGTYSVTIKTQKAGVTLSVYAKDSAGNTSAAATTKVVDVIAPAKPIVNKVDNNDKVVTGKAEVNSTVTVKRGSTVLGTAKANSSGNYSLPIAVQSAGTKLTVTAKDAAGNVSAATTVTVVDVIAPAKPKVNRVDDNDLKVTGKAEANSTVTVKVGSKVLGTAKADSKGNFTVKIKAQKKGTTIAVTAKDAAGNTSQAATLKVVSH